MRLQDIKNAIIKGVLWGSLFLLFLFLTLITLLKVPSIQKNLIHRITTNLDEITGYTFEIEYINLNWFDVLKVEGLRVIDTHDSTMIRIPEARINFSISSLFDKKHRYLDKIKVKNVEVYLYKYGPREPINITKFIDTIKYNLGGKGKIPLTIKEIEIENSEFSFQNHTTDVSYPGFDINNFKLINLNGTASNFTQRHDTITFFTPGLSAIDNKTQLPIHKLSANFTVHQREMIFSNLEARVGNSIITDSITFTYSRMSNLSYFSDSVEMYIRLKKSSIDSKDLALFSKEFRGIQDNYKLSGIFSGTARDFNIRSADLTFGNEGRIRGNLSFAGLPNLEETFIAIRLKQSSASYVDLQPYLGNAVLDKLTGIDHYSFSGNFTGYINDFVAFGNFDTNIGKLITDVNIKVEEDITTYDGTLTTEDFDIGIYSGLKVFQKIDLIGKIKGRGFNISNADFVLDGKISRFGVNGYDIKNISTNAHFASEIFDGSIKIEDPNLKIDARGTIDLRDKINKVLMDVKIDTIEFSKLNLVETPSSLSGKVSVDITGLKIDSIKGSINMETVDFTYDTGRISIDKIYLLSKLESGKRELAINTDRIRIDMHGSYHYSRVYNDFLRLIEEYKLNLENDSENIESYYASRTLDSLPPYQLSLDMELIDINPVLQLFYPGYSISKNVKIESSFSHGYTSILQVNSTIDTLVFDENTFINNLIDINASKISDSSNVLASIFISSENQEFKEKTKTQKMTAQAVWDRNNIDFNFAIKKTGLDTYADVYGDIVFLPDLTVLQLNESDLLALNEKWFIIKNNIITIDKNDILFQNFGISKDKERILFDGSVSEEASKPLKIILENFQVSNFNPLLSKTLTGTGNGFFQIKDYYHDLFVESDILVSDLEINDLVIGDVYSKSTWIKEEEKFDLKFEVEKSGQKIIDISGDFYPGKTEGLKMEAHLTNANLNIIEPFISQYFSDFQGFANGTFTISGNLNNPRLEGTGKIVDGGAKINYLNTYYSFVSDIKMQDNKIGLPNVVFSDRDGNNANFDGNFIIEDLGRIFIDFSGSFTNFLVLNTSLTDNDLFYGTARGSGDIKIKGYPANLTIDVTATTSSNSRIFIPLGGSSDIDQEEFIRFVNFSEEQEDGSENSFVSENIKGLDFNLDLQVTRDAYIELIFDLTAGDIIRGRGNGQLNFNFDAQGEFTMFGDYTIEEGGYNFTLYNIVNKEFTILPDSKLTWFGDPYAGTLDIDASYDLQASVAPLLDTVYRNAPQIRRRYATKVILDLNGPLLSPEINFDITIDEYPNSFSYQGQILNLETELTAVKADWNANDQELQKQVFSLIIMRQFAEKNINTGGSIGRSVSEFVSNQLSYWISQVDENLEINLDLGDLNPETFNTFQMRLSYTFLEGRLRVTRDGGFTDPQNQANMASIIGDWSVEYMLTENGNLRIKLFQETNYNTLDQTNTYDYTAIKGGISILYTQSYDEISEIFKSAQKAKQKSTNNEPTTTTEDSENEINFDNKN